MPSSLVFVALAVAWLVILVPMVARRRQEVARTADSALAARVVHRGGHHRWEEEPMSAVEDTAGDGPGHDHDHDHDYRTDQHDEAGLPEQPGRTDQDDRPQRRYRPGRGGFDPEAAELAARARYAFRQRVVLTLLLTALASGLLAGFAIPVLWWGHAAMDLLLVGYLAYLRRQVRIELEIRQRRAARAARLIKTGAARRTATATAPARRPVERSPERSAERPVLAPESRDEPTEPAAEQLPPPPAPRVTHPGAEVVDLDDEDPAFCELDTEAQPVYRRAAGQ